MKRLKNLISSENKVFYSTIILAGGLGTRLRPLTDKTPKPLIKINNKWTIIDFILNWLNQYVTTKQEICISTYYKSELIYRHLKNDYYSFQFQHEDYGTAGALKLLENKVYDYFIVINGDTITDVDLNDMALQHKNGSPPVDLTVYTENDEIHSGGVYIFNKEILKYIPAKTKYSIHEDLIPKLKAMGKTIALYKDKESFYYDLGTPENLKRIRKYLSG